MSPRFVLGHLAILHLVVGYVVLVSTDDVALGPLDAPQPVEAALTPSQTDVAHTSAPAILAPAIEEPFPYGAPTHLDLQRVRDEDDHLVAELGHGWIAELTTIPKLQIAASRVLQRARVPMGAIVMLDPKTGDVLAMADRFDEGHEAVPAIDPYGPPHLALRALAPAASIFKILSTVALVNGGIRLGTAWRHRIARRRIAKWHVADMPDDAPRATIGEALATSNNGVFARLAFERITAEQLEDVVNAFGFNRIPPFPILTDASTAHVPRGPLERARMAAGFWHTRLTPLHAALIAAAIANRGVMPAPRLVARVRNPDGEPIDGPSRSPFARPISEERAAQLSHMLAEAVENGSARRAFSRRPAALEGIAVAGKTGTLAVRDPYTEYTWFVGFAPVKEPEVAIAVLIGNGELWHNRAVHVARDALGAWFELTRAADTSEAAAIGGRLARH